MVYYDLKQPLSLVLLSTAVGGPQVVELNFQLLILHNLKMNEVAQDHSPHGAIEFQESSSCGIPRDNSQYADHHSRQLSRSLIVTLPREVLRQPRSTPGRETTTI